MNKKTAAVALSGGVDSAAAAIILKNQGYSVTGITMMPYDGFDVEPAGYVAEKLGIEHVVVDLKESFEAEVCQYFIDCYMDGLTPNPCMQCNRKIKYGKLLAEVVRMGFDYMATGHYARIGFDPTNGKYRICCSQSHRKDQSYYLYHLNQEKLAHVLLPLENFSDKKEVRALVADMMPAISDSRDSTDICFAKGKSNLSYIKSSRLLTDTSGIFVDINGRYLGTHNGVYAYTLGQKRGLGKNTGMCVTAINPKDRQIVLGTESTLYKKSAHVREVSYINPENMAEHRISCSVKLCQWGNFEKCTVINLHNAEAEILFDMPSRAPAPGQAAVFYVGDEVIGGGILSF